MSAKLCFVKNAEVKIKSMQTENPKHTFNTEQEVRYSIADSYENTRIKTEDEFDERDVEWRMKEEPAKIHKPDSRMFVSVGLELSSRSSLFAPAPSLKLESCDNLVQEEEEEPTDSTLLDEIPTTSEKGLDYEDGASIQTFWSSVAKSAAGNSCNVCGKIFPSRHRLSKHLVSHSTQRPFFCSFCPKSFKRKEDLGKHLVAHGGEKPFECDTCGRVFVRKQDLRNHLSVHTEHKPFECSVCGKKFGQRGSFSAHAFTHRPDCWLECALCPKRFARKDVLKRHLVVHTGERPYPCRHCGKRFTQPGNLKAHLLTHTGEKAWACGLCGSRFSHNNSLKRHMRTHTGEKDFECKVCNKKFGYGQTLQRHNCQKDVEKG